MTVGELLKWQWNGYPRYHQSRINLALHVAAVPLFLAGNIGLVVSVVSQEWLGAVAGAVVTLVSVILQGRGHKLETNPPEPFTGPANAIGRLFFEQWITFPRFLISGGWNRNWHKTPAAVPRSPGA
jgi:Protein of unknown function (DUF962)